MTEISQYREQVNKEGVNWGTATAMGLFHVGAVAALFFFTWKALLVSMFLWWVSGSLGIGMSYHRLLTHRGYKTPRWVEYFLTWCATLALEGGPIFWVATHRIHHQFSDEDGDPLLDAERQQIVEPALFEERVPPGEEEARIGLQFLAREDGRHHHRTSRPVQATKSTWETYCQILLCANEFVHID